MQLLEGNFILSDKNSVNTRWMVWMSEWMLKAWRKIGFFLREKINNELRPCENLATRNSGGTTISWWRCDSLNLSISAQLHMFKFEKMLSCALVLMFVSFLCIYFQVTNCTWNACCTKFYRSSVQKKMQFHIILHYVLPLLYAHYLLLEICLHGHKQTNCHRRRPTHNFDIQVPLTEKCWERHI